MGTRTDEFKKLETELETVEEKLEQSRKTIWVQRGKAVALVCGGIATLITAILAHFQPERVAQETAGAAATAIEQLQAAVKAQANLAQSSQEACERLSAGAVAKAKAEADSVRTLLLGYLLAVRGKGEVGSIQQARLNKTLNSVVVGLGSAKAETLKPLLHPHALSNASKEAVSQMKAPKLLKKLSKGE